MLCWEILKRKVEKYVPRTSGKYRIDDGSNGVKSLKNIYKKGSLASLFIYADIQEKV